jgi:hypothetical protein
MEKTAKIIKSEFKNEWQNPKGGVIYFHSLELDNGDIGQIGTKDKNPDKISVGSELTYTLENGRIKAVAKPFVKGGGGFKAEPFEHKAAGYAAAYAKDLVVAGKVEIGQMLAIADKIHNWLISKKAE